MSKKIMASFKPMEHRHLNHDRLSLAAVDSIIARGGWGEWRRLRREMRDPEIREKVEKVCQANLANPYDHDLYRRWLAACRKAAAYVARMINVDHYPQLSLLAWNRVVRMVTPEEAFSLYERNWRLVWVADLTPEEKALIRMLRQTVGKGVMRVQRGAYPLPPLTAHEDTAH